ncbi:MAG: YjjW family glycine radical enzyme activase [Nitriliruptorales bacterium]|nr:YjjW family glycine radical enzyme activase [Nitriliruptorales bacterium]
MDGPGNRYVLFLQGCNFDCLNCHNPHTINACNDCGVCIEVCAPGALQLGVRGMEFTPSLCTGCDECLVACPFDSSPMVVERTVADILAELERAAAFLSGITVSGGEPTQQLDFLLELFRAIKQRGDLSHLTTFVDSNGSLELADWDRLAPWLDGAMLDLKSATPELHEFITGQPNAPVLASIHHLFRLGKLHELRLLAIPGLTDTDEELAAFASTIREIDSGIRLVVNAFRHHGVRASGRRWPEATDETVRSVVDRLRGHGLSNVVGPVLSLSL